MPSTLDGLAEHYGIEKNDLPKATYPTKYKTIMSHQLKNKSLIKLIKNKVKYYSNKEFNETGKKYSPICYKDKIVIPKDLQKRVIEWYHHTLCNPGETRTELSIAQYFYWKGLRNHLSRQKASLGNPMCRPTCRRQICHIQLQCSANKIY